MQTSDEIEKVEKVESTPLQSAEVPRKKSAEEASLSIQVRSWI